jgi:hypothetical protein
MTAEKMHDCWKMACDLLQGLEARDLTQIERQIKPLRESLAVRALLTDSAFNAGTILWLEQLDLLEGIIESIEVSLEAIRRSSRPHLLRIQTAEALLRHLVGTGGDPRIFPYVERSCVPDGAPERLNTC